MADLKLLIAGGDYTSFLLTRPRLTEKRAVDQKFVVGDLSVNMANTQGEFSPGNGNFLFAGGEMYGKSLELQYLGVTFWEGIVDHVRETEDRKTATIKARNRLANLKEAIINWSSSDVNPAEDSLEIIRAAGIPDAAIDLPSFQRSADVLAQLGVSVDVNFLKKKKKKTTFVLESLARVSNADLFTARGKIYFKVWESPSPIINIALGEDEIVSVQRDGKQTRYIKNDYLVGYSGDGGNPVDDEDNNDVGSESRGQFGTRTQELDTGDNDNIIYQTQAAAVAVGEKYIARYSQPKDVLKVSFPIDVETDFSLARDFSMTYDRFGYSDKALTPLSITYDFGRKVYTVEALEL